MLRLKLYFYTQSTRTLTCFDLSSLSSGSYLTCFQLVLCVNIRVLFVIIVDFGCFLYFTVSGVILTRFSRKRGDIMSLVLLSYRLRYWTANICLVKGEIFKSFVLGLISYSKKKRSLHYQKKKSHFSSYLSVQNLLLFARPVGVFLADGQIK